MWESYDDSVSKGSGWNTTLNETPGTGKKQGSNVKRAQTIVPIVTEMLTNCKDDEFTIWSYPATILKCVCILKKFEVTSTTVTYELEDHTGTMKAVLWLEHDAGESTEIPVDKENTYVRVFGSFRKKGNENLLMILSIAPIENINEIVTHNLQVMYFKFLQEKKFKGESVSIRVNNPGAELTNSMMSFAGGINEEESMTPLQRTLFRFIKANTTSVGVEKAKILTSIPKNQWKEADVALTYLVSEGHIFTTVDSDHYQLTNLV